MTERVQAATRRVLEEGVEEGVFPGGAACVLRGGETAARVLVGNAAVEPETEPLAGGMVFDVASLTKVMATTPIALKLVDEGRLGLDAPVTGILPDADALGAVTPRHLLAHCAGLPDWKPFYEEFDGDHRAFREELRRKLRAAPPEVEPGTRELYSDVGFLVLQDVVETITGEEFGALVERDVLEPLGLGDTFFVREGATPAGRAFVPSGKCLWRGRPIRGEVEDENTWAMGGVAAHAGLFSTVDDVARFGAIMIDWHRGEGQAAPSRHVVREFFRKAGIVAGSDRCLGWDGPTPGGSSSGRFFSTGTIGHTGFTGTSIWIDLEREIVVVLLTNRVHFTRESGPMIGYRPRFHDAVMEALL